MHELESSFWGANQLSSLLAAKCDCLQDPAG